MVENDLLTVADRFSVQTPVASLRAYERLFRDFRLSAKSIVVIGANDALSRAMGAYFTKATIVCAERRDPVALEALAREHGPIDVVVDDYAGAQQGEAETFRLLWPHVRPGGVFAVENVAPGTSELVMSGPRIAVEGGNDVASFVLLPTGAVWLKEEAA